MICAKIPPFRSFTIRLSLIIPLVYVLCEPFNLFLIQGVQHFEFRFSASVNPHIHHFAYHISVPSLSIIFFACRGGVGLDGVCDEPLPPPLLKSEEATPAGEWKEFFRVLRFLVFVGVDLPLVLPVLDACRDDRLTRDSPCVAAVKMIFSLLLLGCLMGRSMSVRSYKQINYEMQMRLSVIISENALTQVPVHCNH